MSLPQKERAPEGARFSFLAKAMVAWAHERGVTLRLSWASRTKTPTSNHSTACATSASTNTGSPACCMPEPSSKSVAANNKERPKKSLGGMTPSAYTGSWRRSRYRQPGRWIQPLLKTGGRGRSVPGRSLITDSNQQCFAARNSSDVAGCPLLARSECIGEVLIGNAGT